MDAIAEIYEPQWSGYDALQAQAQSSESLWQDFTHKLADQVLIPLNTYTGQFPEMKVIIFWKKGNGFYNKFFNIIEICLFLSFKS